MRTKAKVSSNNVIGLGDEEKVRGKRKRNGASTIQPDSTCARDLCKSANLHSEAERIHFYRSLKSHRRAQGATGQRSRARD
jgi:hypothetical protein